ncbi:MAG TPA: UDP-N-acetylmuramoyl-L-alanine--D-glutamate ligase [Arenimonas sp.]|nr:UDP-N-acetylmuramoyl-L-alanine--D-glutamate ligase [Arenimonas sp.]
MRISALDGRRVAIWGYGREGRAAYAALRARLPQLPLTLFCSADEADAVRALGDPLLTVCSQVDAEQLAAFAVVIKSPGISPYDSPAADAALRGVQFTSGTALWFAEAMRGRKLCITGTKGKSTTAALVAHLLRAGGVRSALCGNVGLPLLELLDVEPAPAVWAIELSSYQTTQAAQPDVAVVLNLYPEHLDWHGSEARYYADKLALLTQGRPRIAVLNAADTRLRALELPAGTQVVWFNDASGWHLREHWLHRGEQRVLDARALPLPGQHNRVNLCAALAAIEALGFDAVPLAGAAMHFSGLPHRLQTLGRRDGIEAVNDSIATTPHATLAALDCFTGRRIALIVGGFDRGLDWGVFVERMARDAPALAVITLGQNGPRIAERLRPLAEAGRFQLSEAGEMEEAVRIARAALGGEGVLLLSPGAPSFPRYRDYTERGRHFAKACGYDPEAISAIAGLGIA